MAALPTGTVTFLFTDIEGSTRLLQRLGEDYVRVLAEHRELLRAAVALHTGREVDTQGDAFFVVFATAGDALACAADTQRALAAHFWPEGATVRVRMGVHTGEPAQTEGGGYVGLDVHRAARICASAHGGQIVLSQATADVAQAHLPPTARLLDLGEHRMRDLERPEHLFQLVLPDLPADFPPLRTPDRRPPSLPVPPTPLLGRDREVSEVRDLLAAGVRLVTLTGPGGIGKTRLSLEVAERAAKSYPDGAYFVELDAVADPNLVATALAQALGLRELGGRGPLEGVRAYLAERRTLVLLDNFEQVVEAAPLVAELLAACQGLAMLVTSREPLHIRGEQEYTVPPLELPDSPAPTGAGVGYTVAEVSACAAVALFVARARAVKPDFALTEANVSAVVTICRRLDGLPLAIELGAARVKLLPPQAMAARLSRSLDLLVGGGRDVPQRQRTLRGAIAWSDELLAPDERRTFRRMAVFAGGCSLEAAEVVGAALGAGNPTPPDAPPSDDEDASTEMLSHLGSLIDKCLLRQQEDDEGEPRIAMLATIRDYALEQLVASGELASIRRAHLAYYRGMAEQAEPHLYGQGQRRWMAYLEREHDNLRAALAWARDEGDTEAFARLAGALWRFWYTHGYVTEGRDWLEAALDRAGAGVAAPLRAKLLYGAATLAATQGDSARMDALGREGLEQYRAAGDKAGEASVLNALGIATLQADDVVEARRLFEEGLALSRSVGDPWGTARILMSLGQVACRERDLTRAAELFEECEALMRQARSISHSAVALLYRGHVARAQGKTASAGAMYREALQLSEQVGDKLRVVRELEALAVTSASAGNDERAARLFGAADGLRETLGTTRHPADAAEVERALAILQERVDAAAFSTLWESGRTQPEQAIAAALGA